MASIRLLILGLFTLCLCGSNLHANPPAASFIFPAGGQRGTTADVRVGGVFLHKSCGFEMLGPGVEASKRLTLTKTLWFEGPLLPLPDSQRQEDYPKDMAGQVKIAADAPLGVRAGRVWTSEGAAGGLRFLVGDLPEIVEQEIAGDPLPVEVKLPLTINGRIFPNEDIDAWSFAAKKGQSFTCEVHAAQVGSPLDAHLEIRDPLGRVLAENDDGRGQDPLLRFTAATDGVHEVRIRDVAFHGGPSHVYRLTLTGDAYVDHVYPLGGRRGTKTSFRLHGQAVPAEPVEIALPPQGDFAYRHSANGKLANPLPLDLDDLPEHLEAEPNDTLAQGRTVTVPAVVNGRIDKAGDVDYWSLSLKKGEALAVQMRAQAFGSPLQGVLTLHDAKGVELARGEAAGANDAALNFTAPADGAYSMRVADRFKNRGGPAFAYRVRLAPPPQAAPDFRLTMAADVLTLARPGKVNLRVNAERIGNFKEAINLTFEGLPPGLKVTPALIAPGQPGADLTFTADGATPINAGAMRVLGVAKIDGRDTTRIATLAGPRGSPAIDSVRLAVALPCPFKIVADFDTRWASRGSLYRRKYKLDRKGFEGPVEIALADRQARHLQGVTGEPMILPPGVNEFEYTVYLPPWMDLGRTCRVCVQGTGIVKEDGVDHAVSFSAIGQNDQIITVVETGRLDLILDKASLLATPGKNVPVPFRVLRGKGLTGPVKVELVAPGHIRGVTVDPIMVPNDQATGTAVFRFAPDPVGPFNMPVTLRATVTEPSGPVVAEAKVELIGKE